MAGSRHAGSWLPDTFVMKLMKIVTELATRRCEHHKERGSYPGRVGFRAGLPIRDPEKQHA